MQEKERGFLLVNHCSSDMIFGLRSQREIGSDFCYLGFVITSWLKRLPLWKIWKRKQNLFYFLWEHTVFVPSDVKNRAGSITHSPYSIRPLTPRCCFFKNIVITSSQAFLCTVPSSATKCQMALLVSLFHGLTEFLLFSLFWTEFPVQNKPLHLWHSISGSSWNRLAPNCKPNNPGVSLFIRMDGIIQNSLPMESNSNCNTQSLLTALLSNFLW